jgi:hypothetical protein
MVFPCDPGVTEFHGYSDRRFTFTERRPVIVDAGKVVQNIIEVPRIAPERIVVKGRVLVDGKAPRPEIQVKFANRSGFAEPAFQGPISEDETFEAQLPEGLFGVVVSDLPAGYEVRAISSGTVDLLKHPLLVSRAAEPPTLTITLGASRRSSGVRVRGQIMGSLADAGYMPIVADYESGQLLNHPCLETRTRPTPRIDLTLDDSWFAEETEFSAVIGRDGSFEFPSVPSGTYSARIATSNQTPPGTAIAPIHMVVPNRDVRDLELPAPPPFRLLGGRVEVVDGEPLPNTVALTFLPLRDAAPVPASSSALTRTLAAPDAPWPFRVLVVPKSDGTFTVGLREGRYEVTAAPLADSYRVESLTYGNTNLLQEPLAVTHGGAALLRLTLSPPSSGVKVSGRVRGLDLTGPERGSAFVTMQAYSLYAELKAAIRLDGSFEFPRVFPGRYFVEVHMPDAIIDRSFKNIEVTSTGVQDLEMTVAYRKEATGRMNVQGRGPLAVLWIPLANPQAPSARVEITPKPDGTFTATLPVGEWRVADVVRLPPGYTLQSLTYGTADMLRDTFKVTRTDTAEIRVTLSTATVPVKVRGRVVDLPRRDKASAPFCVRLLSSEYAATLSAIVQGNGSFEFPEVYPGSYYAEIGPADAPVGQAEVTVANVPVRNIEIKTEARKDGVIVASPCVQ